MSVYQANAKAERLLSELSALKFPFKFRKIMSCWLCRAINSPELVKGCCAKEKAKVRTTVFHRDEKMDEFRYCISCKQIQYGNKPGGCYCHPATAAWLIHVLQDIEYVECTSCAYRAPLILFPEKIPDQCPGCCYLRNLAVDKIIAWQNRLTGGIMIGAMSTMMADPNDDLETYVANLVFLKTFTPKSRATSFFHAANGME